MLQHKNRVMVPQFQAELIKSYYTSIIQLDTIYLSWR